MIGMTLPHDTQFIQFFLAGLNEAERLNIEDANANEPFDTYAKLLDYLTRRKTIWITLQTRYETQLQEQRNLNVHQSRLNNHQSLTEPNNTTLGQHNQQTDVQKIADAVTTSMTNFTKKIEQSLTAMSTAIMNVSERKQQTYDYADRIQPERVSNLNNHRVEHHQHYSNPYSYERMGSRANSRWSNHHSSEHTRYLNYNGSSSSSHSRSRSPYNNNNRSYDSRSRGRTQPYNTSRSRSTSPLGGTNNCYACGHLLHQMIDCPELTDEERDVQCTRIVYKSNMNKEQEESYRSQHNLLNQPPNKAQLTRQSVHQTLNRGQPGYCHWCNSCGHYTINCTRYCVLCKQDGHNWRECTTTSRDVVERRTRQLQTLIIARQKQMEKGTR